MIMLYLSFLTLFSPWFLEDLERMHKRKGDCFGMCCCKEDSILCCKGKFLSERNKKFSNLMDYETTSDGKSDEYASIIEALIAKYLAPEVLSNQGRALILVAWILMIGFSLNGA